MSKATYPLKLPTSVKDAAARLAREDGVSLNQWIAAAASFLKSRACNTTGAGLRSFLDRVPDRPPQADDELER